MYMCALHVDDLLKFDVCFSPYFVHITTFYELELQSINFDTDPGMQTDDRKIEGENYIEGWGNGKLNVIVYVMCSAHDGCWI